MKPCLIALMVLLAFIYQFPGSAESTVVFAGEKRLNNLVSELLEASSISKAGNSFSFTRPDEGWIFISAAHTGKGTCSITLDNTPPGGAIVVSGPAASNVAEAARYVTKGEHTLRVDCQGEFTVDRLVVKAIPELIDCGLFDPAIKSYGRYDMDFLRKDILPNITTLIVPSNIKLDQSVIDDWRRQGKKFVAQAGVSAQGKTSGDHFQYWTNLLDTVPFADGIIIDEFIVNKPSARPGAAVSPQRQERMQQEQQRHRAYEEAFRQIRADDRYENKTMYAYIGGSGKKLNQESIGPTFVRTLIDCNYPVALERYLFERSSPKASQDALQEFIDGIADWEAKEPGVKKDMILTFGLFSMPPGGINKLPNVDYHVWMDQQMNIVANDPVMSGMRGLNWWTSSQADEETVRFVGKLYRHYAIEGKTDMLTRDPLFLTHTRNADFQNGTEGWKLHPAQRGSIFPKSFPRYGRIEGRYMGLGRPADPEHIGDTFLVMKRSANKPNTFSQTIKHLEPGRMYSMKMFSCDYNDLVNPKSKTKEEATGFIGKAFLKGADIDSTRSFREMYASNPEPPIPVWITYHWIVFKPRGKSAKLTVSDWDSDTRPTGPVGQEQTFNFLEIEPYHE
ncbi:MAG: hypothetical protein NTZ09_19910 [Candidatus Hydrogenedentes bacterium]|nr:hypothetical protein [Candidatus Hydrogenedentota bacterium]